MAFEVANRKELIVSKRKVFNANFIIVSNYLIIFFDLEFVFFTPSKNEVSNHDGATYRLMAVFFKQGVELPFFIIFEREIYHNFFHEEKKF